MKTYHYDSSKNIEGIKLAAIGLSMKEVEVLQQGPGQFLVRVNANSLNFVDLSTLSGAFPVDGRIPLLDGAGVVEIVGDRVDKWRVGDRVVGPNLRWEIRSSPIRTT